MKIYHNPRCSKSRDSYKLLENENLDFEVVEYLKEPLTKDEIKKLLQKLQIPVEDLIRKGEKEYKDNFKGKELTENQWIEAMV